MSEGLLLVIWICKFLLIGICAVLYRVGGWINKAFRRFLMPILYLGGCAGIALWKGNYSNYIWISLPILIFALCLGYSNNDGKGWLKRLKIGILLALAFLNFAFIFGGWILYAYHCALCISAMMVFGVLNPFPSAVDEESFIAVCCLLMPIAMI